MMLQVAALVHKDMVGVLGSLGVEVCGYLILQFFKE